MSRTLAMLAGTPDLFNTLLVDPAARDRLVIAENDHALALAGVGHRYPTVEILSTARANRPWEHDTTALRGLSDLLHACHAATGRLVPTNEEWHYRPVDVGIAMPWRINLKWRVSTLAGFEGGTKINVNTISPFTLRDRMVNALRQLRDAGRIGALAIGDECSHRPGALRYALA
jgi:galactose-1-phosphate uridylyltransferase